MSNILHLIHHLKRALYFDARRTRKRGPKEQHRQAAHARRRRRPTCRRPRRPLISPSGAHQAARGNNVPLLPLRSGRILAISSVSHSRQFCMMPPFPRAFREMASVGAPPRPPGLSAGTSFEVANALSTKALRASPAR